MDFSAPLSTILNNGLLGAILVLSLLVNWWQQRARERDKQELLVSYDRRLHDAQAMGTAYNDAVHSFTDTLKDVTRQNEQVNATALAVSKGVEQLLYRKGAL